jgi:hypothetical protein
VDGDCPYCGHAGGPHANEIRLEAATGKPIRCQDCISCTDEMLRLAESDAAQLLARDDQRVSDLLQAAGWHSTGEARWAPVSAAVGDSVGVNQALTAVLLERLWRPQTR